MSVIFANKSNNEQEDEMFFIQIIILKRKTNGSILKQIASYLYKKMNDLLLECVKECNNSTSKN
jgi:hypothetical protein